MLHSLFQLPIPPASSWVVLVSLWAVVFWGCPAPCGPPMGSPGVILHHCCPLLFTACDTFVFNVPSLPLPRTSLTLCNRSQHPKSLDTLLLERPFGAELFWAELPKQLQEDWWMTEITINNTAWNICIDMSKQVQQRREKQLTWTSTEKNKIWTYESKCANIYQKNNLSLSLLYIRISF